MEHTLKLVRPEATARKGRDKIPWTRAGKKRKARQIPAQFSRFKAEDTVMRVS